MSTFNLIKKNKENYSIEGDITFFSLNKKSIKSFDFLKSANEICIDLAKVDLADSAGLALMIEWIKHSKLYGTKLTFKNIPQQIQILATLCGFEYTEYIAHYN